MGKEPTRVESLKILGLNEGYSLEDLKINYKRLLKVYHPDSGGAHDDFIFFQKAYEELKNNPVVPVKRSSPKSQYYKEPTFPEKKNPVDATSKMSLRLHITQIIKDRLESARRVLISYIVFKRYLSLSYGSQSLLLILLINLPKGNFLYYTLLAVWFLLINCTALVILSLFHKPFLGKILGIDSLSVSAKVILRNASLILYPLLTLPGFLCFIMIALVYILLMSVLDSRR